MNKTILVLISISLLSCRENYTPKPRGFFKLSFLEKQSQQYNQDCPFTFQFPTYSKIQNLEKNCFFKTKLLLLYLITETLTKKKTKNKKKKM